MATLGDFDIVTDPCRLSFPELFEPKPRFKDSPRMTYQATLILPPSFDLAPLRAMVQKAHASEWKGVMLPAKRTKENMATHGNPIRKAEEKANEGVLPKGYEAGGHFISVHGNDKPYVVDERANVVLDKTKFYSGCWARFHLQAFVWENSRKWGVSFGLCGVQFVKDDARLGGSRGANPDAFKPIDGAAPAAAAGGTAKSDQDSLFG